jgi:hypothetical protein
MEVNNLSTSYKSKNNGSFKENQSIYIMIYAKGLVQENFRKAISAPI